VHVEPRARHERARIGQPVASCQRRLFNAHQVQGAPLTRPTNTGVAILCVNAPHPYLDSGRHHGERVSDLHPASARSTGRHRSASRQRKDAIYTQTKQAVLRVLRPVCRCRVQVRAQGGDAGIPERGGGEGKERRLGQRRRRQQRLDLRLHRADARVIRPIDLRQGDGAVGNSEQFQYREVFASLRHHAVVGRDDQHRKVDSARAGDHRVHQALVTRYIHESQDLAVGERRVRIT